MHSIFEFLSTELQTQLNKVLYVIEKRSALESFSFVNNFEEL